MTASNFVQPPASSLPVAGLNVQNVKVQPSKEQGHVVARKVADLNVPSLQHQHQHHDEPQLRRRKRDVFLALFKPSSKHDRVLGDAKPTATAVPVQIPSGYMNPNHKGSLVSGRRVAYSRNMHQGRKANLVKRLESAIPEDEQMLEFPATQAQKQEAQEKAAREANQNKCMVARSLFF